MLSVWGEVQICIMAQLMPLPLTVSCSIKSRLVLPFWYRLTLVVPDKRPLNGCKRVKEYCVKKTITLPSERNLIYFFSFLLTV